MADVDRVDSDGKLSDQSTEELLRDVDVDILRSVEAPEIVDDCETVLLGFRKLEDPVDRVKGHPADPVDRSAVRHVVVPEASEQHGASGRRAEVGRSHDDLAHDNALQLGIFRQPQGLVEDALVGVGGLPLGEGSEPRGSPLDAWLPVEEGHKVRIAHALALGSQLGLEVGQEGFEVRIGCIGHLKSFFLFCRLPIRNVREKRDVLVRVVPVVDFVRMLDVYSILLLFQRSAKAILLTTTTLVPMLFEKSGTWVAFVPNPTVILCA